MASKIFTGDMSELMKNILNNLDNEIYSYTHGHLILFISNYFSSNVEDEKFVLKEECGINKEISETLLIMQNF
ncbi:hypothetical protein C2G38_2179340 [Gigaspora rosea]|uniref:Uncharacterized protein n=1 Tax=Gigaspora rosea TaxID=44941 RepID=A0A397VF48_9GLOM|nr:hypothetical protein C2G38_2236071 [Gigaspora rosea]RIB20418.1 hypothetical protein C2G38_2179340 [Gigaspora rosea]